MIEVKDIRKSFGNLEVLKGVSLSIGQGEVVSIVGPSGAGKTTLLQIMGTLDKPDSGSVMLNQTAVHQLKSKALAEFRNRQIGFVFQFHQLLPEFTALENVMIPALIGHTPAGEARERAVNCWISWAFRTERLTSRRNCQAERSSVWQWPAHW